MAIHFFSSRSRELNPDEIRIMELLKKCTDVLAFEYEGVKYLGYHVTAIKQFVADNPQPADFHVWLQNNYKQIK